jgi:hypothetical protein
VNFKVFQERARFLRAVANLQPEVLESLKAGPFKVFANSGVSARQALASANGKPALLGKALDQWGKRWNLTNRWCRDWAVVTLEEWSRGEESEPLRWCDEINFLPLGSIDLARPDFKFRFEPWFPEDEPWSKYSARLKKGLGEQLQKYRTKVNARTDSRGETIGPELREAERHSVWLAGFQVCGWSKRQITMAARPKGEKRNGERTAGMAINKLAELIGLSLRPAAMNDPKETEHSIRAALLSVTTPSK